MSKPLVLHVINGLQAGGAETLLFRLVTRQSRFDHEVVSLVGRDWYSPLLEQRGVNVYHLDMKSAGSTVQGLVKLHSLVRTARPDIIQSWMYNANLLAGVVARARGIPVVWGIHSSSLDGLGLSTQVAARFGGMLSGRLADRIINCSRRSAELHGAVGYSEDRVTVVHNGYDPTAFFPDDASRFSTRHALSVEDDRFLIGSVARWNSRKDVPNLLEALRLLRRRSLRMHCVLIGRDLDQSNPALVSALERLGCAQIVSALGQRTDVQTLVRALDLHVLPSATEAFPNAVAETMLSRTPNVVTDVGDAALIVGDSGWIVPPRDPAKLARAIEEAFHEWEEKPRQWQERRARARARVVDRFTLDMMAEGYEQVWRGVINARDARHASRWR